MREDHKWVTQCLPRVFRTGDAATWAISRRALLDSERFPTIVHGVRADMNDLDEVLVPKWADSLWLNELLRFRAVVLKHPNVVAGHLTAARLYGWPLPRRLTWTPGHSRLWVASDEPDLRIRLPRVKLVRMTELSSIRCFNHSLLDPVRTFISMGPVLDVHELVRIGDALIGQFRSPPLTDVETIRRHIDNSPRVASRKQLLRALDLVRPTVDSPKETDLRLWAVSVGLPEPSVHPKIWSRMLARWVEPDLGFEGARLALEYEGAGHLRSKQQWNRDIQRDEALIAENWTVLKVTSSTDFALLERKIRHHFALAKRRAAAQEKALAASARSQESQIRRKT